MAKPVLSGIQRSWLQEIGIDARMLAHFSMEPFAPEAATTAKETGAPDSGRQTSAAAPSAPAPGANAGPIKEAGAAASPVKGVSPGAAIIADLLKRTPGVRSPGGALPSAVVPVGAAIPEVSNLAALREQAEQCMACGLHEVRGRVVFGEGMESSPQWMFIGEAPGEFDDSVGRPFQGRAGELLRAMLASVGFPADGPAYFTNVLKCRPMSNRSPQPAEIAACQPLLRKQIQLLQPGCVVALGRVAAAALLGRDDDLDLLRGQVHRYVDEDGREIPLVVTHHPASLLLHGQLKAEAWRDLNLLAGVTDA